MDFHVYLAADKVIDGQSPHPSLEAIGSDTPYKTAGVVVLGFTTIVLAARAAPGSPAAVGAMRPAAARP
jgi:hypothetical protein